MREYSAGSVRKSRGQWQAVLSYWEDGKRRQPTKMTGIPCKPGRDNNAGKQAALKFLAEWRAELVGEAEQKTEEVQTLPTLAEHLNAYITGQAGHVEPSTVYGYQTVARRQVLPYAIATKRLDELTRADVRAWLAELREAYGPTTITKALVLVRSALRQAVGDELITRNAAEGAKAPKKPSPKPNAIRPEQRGRLAATLAAAEQTPDVVGFRMAYYTGMREGEVCALRWRNVDLAARTLSVREALGKVGGSYYLKEPKTGGSRRTVNYPEPLADALRARRTDMMEQCMAAGVAFSPDMFVLGGIDRDEATGDYRYMNPHVLWQRWAAMAKLLGLVGTQGRRPTFHDLRHTFATAAIAEGVDVKTVSSALGHANAAMTLNVYADADPEAKRRAADVVAAALERGGEPAGEVLAFRPTGTEGR